jgi:hypothetical protein
MEQLHRDLEQLRKANEARFQNSPGLSRTVVVEMTDPTNKEESVRQDKLKLSDRVAESIAKGVDASKTAGATTEKTTDKTTEKHPDKTKEPLANQDVHLSGADRSWTGDLVIEKGLPNTGMFNLQEGTQIRHLDFPVDQAAEYRGLVPLTEGWFYDQFSDLLWKPTGKGHEYLGQKAPVGFDAENFTPVVNDAPAVKPAPSTTMTDQADLTNATDIISPTPPVRGYPIFDETTGSGSIILQNLPDPATGEIYQLWVTDPATKAPISIGVIPPLDAGGGRVWFDLGGPGVAPSGYLLTREISTGASVPSTRVVLRGP